MYEAEAKEKKIEKQRIINDKAKTNKKERKLIKY